MRRDLTEPVVTLHPRRGRSSQGLHGILPLCPRVGAASPDCKSPFQSLSSSSLNYRHGRITEDETFIASAGKQPPAGRCWLALDAPRGSAPLPTGCIFPAETCPRTMLFSSRACLRPETRVSVQGVWESGRSRSRGCSSRWGVCGKQRTPQRHFLG